MDNFTIKLLLKMCGIPFNSAFENQLDFYIGVLNKAALLLVVHYVEEAVNGWVVGDIDFFKIFPWKPYQPFLIFFPMQYSIIFVQILQYCPQYKILGYAGRPLWKRISEQICTNLFHVENGMYRRKLQNRWKKCYYRFANSAIKDIAS